MSVATEDAVVREPAGPRRAPAVQLQFLAVGAAVLLVSLWRIGTPSLWKDEAATAIAARSGLSGILATSRQVDAVHAPFYLLQWLWTSVAGSSETALRIPSALAVAVTAMCLLALARTYLADVPALLCVVVFVLVPTTSRYAQEAREGALVMCLAVASVLLLQRALAMGGTRRWVMFAAVSAAVPLLNLISAYMIVPLVLIAVYEMRAARGVAVALPMVITAAMMAAVTMSQRATMLDVFLGKPALHDFTGYADQLFGSRPVALLLVASAALFTALALMRRVAELSWLVAILVFPVPAWIVSQVEPVFFFRYGLFTVPFFALAVALALQRWWLLVGYAALLAGLSAGLHAEYRSDNGHRDDFRALYAAVDRQARPGDAIISDNWLARAAMEYYQSGVIADPLDPGSTTSAAIRMAGGLPCTADALAQAQRVWYISTEEPGSTAAAQNPSVCDPGLTMTKVITVGGLEAQLYGRQG